MRVLLPALALYILKHYLDTLASGNGSIWSVAAISLLLITTAIGRQNAYFHINTLGLALRKALTAMLFAKSIKLSLASLSLASTGKLVNLASGDMALI